ncbi:hypothetical protein F511_35671 [Dorcoceras hygrometricum]|uniref:CCHC-type domain-containing protein n=1 Tax=Dorcoceras hygrometricum TaxID=472368 RepID=A0A2Z7CZS5_9LAMI|nr:hypothetical protein F511_35671 [Dorcoceras hygrometricum]
MMWQSFMMGVSKVAGLGDLLFLGHAEPLGSLGLNGAGDDPVDEYIPTGAYFFRLPAVGSSNRSKSGSAGLLFSRPFFLYLFRRLWVSSKRIGKEATLCSLLEFEQICFSVQVLDLSARDLVVVIVAQKVMDACIEDERQYRAPHLPAGFLIATMSRVIMVSQLDVKLIQLVVPREKKSGSSSSGSGSSSSSSPEAEFCGQCGGKHPTAQCVWVQGACNNCGQYGHLAWVCPLAGSQHTAAPPQGRPGGSSRGRSFPVQQQRVGET